MFIQVVERTCEWTGQPRCGLETHKVGF